MVPAISIIIPAHNEEKYIRETLHSIKTQTYQNYEVIVVSNGSIDKTEEIVHKRTNEKLKLFSMNQANVSRARNYGAGKAEGDILFFLDADTTLESNALQKVHEQFLEEHAVASTLSKPDISNFKFNVAHGFKNFYMKSKIYKGCSGALICRKKDFDEVNGFDPQIIVREHSNLIKRLQSYGTFTCLNTTVTTSTRRFASWGLRKSSSFWIKQWFKEKFGTLEQSEYEKVR